MSRDAAYDTARLFLRELATAIGAGSSLAKRGVRRYCVRANEEMGRKTEICEGRKTVHGTMRWEDETNRKRMRYVSIQAKALLDFLQ